MRKIIFLTLSTLALAGCGGGDGGTSTTGGSAPVPAPAPSVQISELCGVEVGSKRLEGVVTHVHDGDTLTLNSAGMIYKIRLDSIDAPELAQISGALSQSTLANEVLGKPVKVAYTKTDQYERIVGAVFTNSCQYVNLNQVSKGMAWFYKAYQCEITAPVRKQFIQAQDDAVNAKLGLWMQSDPEAPWFYRNGSEPVTPICSSDSPAWLGSFALSSGGSTTPANSSVTIPASPPVATKPSTPVVTLPSKTCYTGPRGGTYTLTANGNKNYGGC